MTKLSFRWFIPASMVFAAAIGFGCSSSNSGTGATAPIGEVIGPPDSHCGSADGGLTVQSIGVCEVIDPARMPAASATCNVTFTPDTGGGGDVDASVPADAGAPTSDYGPTMYGSAGNDDDCKYYVSWISTPIVEKADTYFILTAVRLSDMKPATCAGVIPDVSLDNPNGGLSLHGIPAPRNPSPEIAPGVYKVGPIPFDKPGTWTVRFHLFEECSDDPDDSPHGHAAFYVNVP